MPLPPSLSVSASIGDGAMPVSTQVTNNLLSLFASDTPFLDVRAPFEFSRGAMPGAVNLPLLDDRQRELVGTCYKKAGQEAAIELGNSLATAQVKESRIAAWQSFIDSNPSAVLYCFRGGLRSQICQQWLAESGVSIKRVAGGYKSMRQYLLAEIETATKLLPLVVLGGRTGTGKTHLLLRLQRFIDLEGLACHRGSSFGKLPDAQPSNADFENSLAVNMLRHRLIDAGDKGRDTPCSPIFLEDEAKLIGRVALPQILREKMAALPMVLLEESMQRRVDVARMDYVEKLLGIYQSQLGADAGFEQWVEQQRHSLHRIRKRLGGAAYAQASELLERAIESHRRGGDTHVYGEFIEFLLSNYYDPMYDYQLKQKNRPILFRGTACELYEWAKSSPEHLAEFKGSHSEPVAQGFF